LDVRLTTCSGKNIFTKSKEAMAGMSEIRQPMKRFMDLRIGSWNVLSLYRSKPLQLLLDQLEKYYGGTEPYKKSSGCSGRRKKTEGQVETEMGRWCDGRWREVGGERNWRSGARNRDSWQKLLKKTLGSKGGCCANDDDDDDDDDDLTNLMHKICFTVTN